MHPQHNAHFYNGDTKPTTNLPHGNRVPGEIAGVIASTLIVRTWRTRHEPWTSRTPTPPTPIRHTHTLYGHYEISLMVTPIKEPHHLRSHCKGIVIGLSNWYFPRPDVMTPRENNTHQSNKNLAPTQRFTGLRNDLYHLVMFQLKFFMTFSFDRSQLLRSSTIHLRRLSKTPKKGKKTAHT